jgi:stage III sporulation protein SpoIIIAA
VILYNDSKLNGFEKDSLYDRLQVKPEHGLVISVNSEFAGYLQEHPGANISLCVDVERKGIACNNVIGFTDNMAPYTVIIGAHYDHLGLNRQGIPVISFTTFKIVTAGIDHLLVVGQDE